MANHITNTGIQAVGNVDAILIQCNAALTGSLTVTVAGDTNYGTSSGTIAVITNPTVGSTYQYGGLRTFGATSINVSATCDITVTPLKHLL